MVYMFCMLSVCPVLLLASNQAVCSWYVHFLSPRRKHRRSFPSCTQRKQHFLDVSVGDWQARWIHANNVL